MKKISVFLLIASFLILNISIGSATLTPTKIPVTKTGGSSPTVQDGSITDTGTSSGSGNVGIGSTAPTQVLDVTGNINVSGYVTTNSNIDTLLNQNGGNVGIGTNAVQTTLGVKGTLNNTALAVGQTYAMGANTTINNGSIFEGNVGIGTPLPNGGRLIVVGGNVGISSVSPGQALDVQGTLRGIGFATNTGIGTTGTGTTSCLCKTYSGGICTVIGTCT